MRVDAYPTADGVPVEDLTQNDFQVLEDGVVQKLEQFERVVVRGNVPTEMRRDPNTVAESRGLLESTRGRVFVIFLDLGHVNLAGSHDIRQPLINMLDRLIGVDDLVGVMTPDMSATDVTFARKTATIEGMLTRYWTWGEKDATFLNDPVERNYQQCYPGFQSMCPTPDGKTVTYSDEGVAAEMILRRREKFVLDSLEDISRFLGGVREERKAVLVISSGLTLFTPNANLARQVRCDAPGVPQVGIDPRGGKLTTKPPPQLGASSSMYECDRDRLNLAQLDDAKEFLRLPDIANRANVSFYPINPNGLEVFDTPLSQAVPDLTTDMARLGRRTDSLRVLADNTDGMAIVNTNDLASGVSRIVADLSSYYLLGYYSTNTKADGTFRKIAVRVRRPGVHVRARRGYLAATAAELERSRASAAAASPEAAAAEAEAHAIEAAIGPLGAYSRELPLRIQIAATRTGVWAVGEAQWKDGGEADVMLIAPGGATVATAHTSFPAGSRGFRAALVPGQPLEPGEYTVRVRARGTAAGSIPANDALRFTLSKDAAVGAVFIRRGPATANREVPTADLRFRRGETLRVEVPATAAGDATARLLDKTGKPLGVPVTAATRTDADGSRWHTAQLALAPLAAGDYVIEAAASGSRTLVAFRVVP